MRFTRQVSICSLILALGVPLGAQEECESVPFLRADANSDGKISFSDSFRVLRYLFVPEEVDDWTTLLDCFDAADANDSGSVDIADAAAIVSFLLLPPGLEFQLPAPYPGLGHDPTPNDPTTHPECGCRSYGERSPIEDASTRVEIIEAGARGGDDSIAYVRMSVTSTRRLGGFGARIVTEGRPYSVYSGRPLPENFYGLVSERDDGFWAFALPNIGEGGLATLDASESADLFEFAVCFDPGTTAGDYELSVDDVEIIDFETGLPIYLDPASGTIHLLQDISSDPTCSVEDNPPPAPIHGRFELGSVSASPGSIARVPFYVQADAGVQGYSVSIDFDENVLSGVSVDEVWSRPDGGDLSFARFEFNNESETPGAEGLDEGYLAGAVVLDTKLPTTMPANSLHHALDIRFQVDAETLAEATPLEFEDGARLADKPTVNMIIANQRRVYTQENAASFVLVGALVGVLPDILVFVRGDANSDGRVDLSDPVATLGFLFLGMESVECTDAADADDSGILDITDAIYTLGYLFLGGPQPEAPFPIAGLDTTDDQLSCEVSGSDA
ncbi:MAG: hypothetical protein AAF517_24110 [Planctomycetota bacterium]